MVSNIERKTLCQIAGGSYLIIFFTGIFANFFVIEALIDNPLTTVQQDHMYVRAGILAFMLMVIFDVVVAWALYELYREDSLAGLSMLFRVVHAVIMGVAIFSLPPVLDANSAGEVLILIDTFNTIWLIGLFFFGVHLILLAKIIIKPRFIALLLALAGMMYMIDTAAQFTLPDYENYASVFLALVAIPAILGEMSFAIWLLIKKGKS